MDGLQQQVLRAIKILMHMMKTMIVKTKQLLHEIFGTSFDEDDEVYVVDIDGNSLDVKKVQSIRTF